MMELNPNHYRIAEIIREAQRLRRGFFGEENNLDLPGSVFVSGLGDFGMSITFTNTLPNVNRIINFLASSGVTFGVEARDFLNRPAVGFSRDMRDQFPQVCARIALMCELAVNQLLLF